MDKVPLLCVVALGFASVSYAQVQVAMTEAQVQQAIVDGFKSEGPAVLDYVLNRHEPMVSIMTPYADIRARAAEAHRTYGVYFPSDVPKSMLGTFTVFADPFFVGGEEKISAPLVAIDRIVLVVHSAAGGETIVQPVTERREEKSWSNSFGASRKANGVRASFPLKLLVANTEVRVVMGDRESRLPVTQEFLSKIH